MRCTVSHLFDFSHFEQTQVFFAFLSHHCNEFNLFLLFLFFIIIIIISSIVILIIVIFIINYCIPKLECCRCFWSCYYLVTFCFQHSLNTVKCFFIATTRKNNIKNYARHSNSSSTPAPSFVIISLNLWDFFIIFISSFPCYPCMHVYLTVQLKLYLLPIRTWCDCKPYQHFRIIVLLWQGSLNFRKNRESLMVHINFFNTHLLWIK